MIVGFITPDEGKVYLDEMDVTKEAMYIRARKGLGYLPQEPSVFRKLSVENNIKAILEMGSLSKEEQKSKLESLIDEFQLSKVRKNPGTHFQVVNGVELKLPEPSLQILALYSLTNLLQGLIRLP